METFILYAFISGLIYTSWLWDSKNPFGLKVLCILHGVMYGWWFIPVLIGRMIAKYYKNK